MDYLKLGEKHINKPVQCHSMIYGKRIGFAVLLNPNMTLQDLCFRSMCTFVRALSYSHVALDPDTVVS